VRGSKWENEFLAVRSPRQQPFPGLGRARTGLASLCGLDW